MNFVNSIKSVFDQIFTIKGRAPRSEYWFFVLFIFLWNTAIGLFIESGLYFLEYVNAFVTILFLIAHFTLSVRRLHDIDFSGWWVLLNLIPVLGTIVLFFFFIKKGTDGHNQFGPDPLVSHPYLEKKAEQNRVS